jgi:hypothetical protein
MTANRSRFSSKHFVFIKGIYIYTGPVANRHHYNRGNKLERGEGYYLSSVFGRQNYCSNQMNSCFEVSLYLKLRGTIWC